MSFLPISKKDMEKRGWDYVDFVVITGDAYVDHPSFGISIISRVLERQGFRVGIISQPNYKTKDDFMKLGRPRLAFLISSGNVDSMVNNYSVFKKKRKQDQYAPGGQYGNRPDRAVTVYSNRVKEAYKNVPVVIGGIEASLRRLGHYDYWDNKIKRSVLLDSGADILIYGMGERSIVEIAEALDSGIDVKDIGWIKGTCVKKNCIDEHMIQLPTFEEIKSSKEKYCESFVLQYTNNDYITGEPLAEKYGENLYVVQNPPQQPLENYELDNVYNMNFERKPHPIYNKDGGVPGINEVQFSLVSNRGCFGGCSFCAITYHQGKSVRGRGKESIIEEAKKIVQEENFKGYIHDLGGPTANFRGPSCEKQLVHGICKTKDCLFPNPCKHLIIDHSEYLDILRTLRNIEGIKKVFIRSGIRYDYLMADKDDEFFHELCQHHISGTLKVAPEHISPQVLEAMRKPSKEVFEDFVQKYFKINNKLGKKQFLIPYFISSHPGSTLEDAINLAEYLHETGFIPDQVQDFYPTPGTLATVMYYTELNPFTMEKIYVAKDMKEKKLQRALIHFHKKENKSHVITALRLGNRADLIDKFYGKEKGQNRKNQSEKNQNRMNHKRKDSRKGNYKERLRAKNRLKREKISSKSTKSKTG